MRRVDTEEGREPQNYGPVPEQNADMVPRADLESERARTDAILAAQRHRYEQERGSTNEQQSTPDLMEDPIRNLDGRLSAMEEQRQISQMTDTAGRADIEGRGEYGVDHDAMVSHLHKEAFAEAERQAGRRLTEPERHRYLQGATMAVMAEAAQRGIPISHHVRSLAIQTGYVPQQAFGLSEYRRLDEALGKAHAAGDGDAFDKIWAMYEKGELRSERRR
jgi:hypothetical protein